MRRVLVIQHESYEALGTWESLLKDTSARIRFVNFERTPDASPTLDRCGGIILLGGYMGVYEQESYAHLKLELKLIEEALKREIPILGICLGSQILAAALGASVRPHVEREMGWYDVELTEAGRDDAVLGHFRPIEKVFQSHGDAFDLPHGAVHLARSALCPSQAFRYGRNAYGLQFHLEVNRAIVDDWLEMPMNRELFAASGGKFEPAAIERDTERYLPRSMELSGEAFRRFLRIAGARYPQLRLGSGR